MNWSKVTEMILQSLFLLVYFYLHHFDTVKSNFTTKNPFSKFLKDPKLQSSSTGQDQAEHDFFVHQSLFNDSLFSEFPSSKKNRLKRKVKSMFEFAYDGYMQYAYPLDELDPINRVVNLKLGTRA